jgi:SAM-dependent methyltransferase
LAFERRYAQLYDTIYSAKDYAFEVGQVLEFAHRYGVEVRTIVDYGCGTGNHARRFAEKGIKVYGIDRSQDMLAAAREKTRGLQNVEFLHDSELAAIPEFSVDIFCLLFDVVSYIVENDALDRLLSYVVSRLKPQGLFVFDFWYGPGVLSLRPVNRWKEFEANGAKILRLTRADLDWDNSTVNVTHEIIVTQENQLKDRFVDDHVMRFFFKREINYLLQAHGLEVVQFGTWQAPESPPTTNDWSALIVSRHFGREKQRIREQRNRQGR